ncbi:MAG: sodium:solute symporter family protein [Lentisphaeria bacterium]|nr:sodium:solute symporter family protein [Lentisphaeria bacterium]
MNTVVLGTLIALYVLVIGYLGYRGFRRTRSSSDYLLAGRATNPFVMAMSYGAAFISTSALVGFGGVAGQFGMGLLWLVFMNIAIGVVAAFIFFGRRTRAIGEALGATTFPDFIGKRFRSSGLKVFVAAIIFLFIPLYSSVVLIGGARFLEEVMHIPYAWALGIFALVVAIYVIFGGLKGVMYVDALMGTVMICGMLLLLFLCYRDLGGVIPAHRALTDLAPLVRERMPKFYELGHRGWTVMPAFNTAWWWTLVSSLMLGVGIGALAQPQLAVRFMTVRSTRELNRAVLVGSVFLLCTVGSAYTVGALSNVSFFRAGGKLAFEAADGNVDKIIPMFINKTLPPVVLYLFALTMLSAAMSTMSSLFHVTGSSIGHDIVRTVSRSGRASVAITRGGVLFGIVVSVIVAALLPPGIVARGTAIFFGVSAAAFLPAYAGAIYWKRTTTPAVWASVSVGLGASLFGLLFLHAKESASLGLCQALFGKPCLIPAHPWPVVDPFIYALPLAALTLVAVSLCTAPLPEHFVERCFPGKKARNQ